VRSIRRPGPDPGAGESAPRAFRSGALEGRPAARPDERSRAPGLAEPVLTADSRYHRGV